MASSPAQFETRFETMRHAMVASQLRTNAVSDQRVVLAMARVPREAFVPAEARAIAYRDTAVPLANGRMLNVPIATGKLLTEAAIVPSDRVLLVGAACGYTAAVLSELAADVTALEQDPALAGPARNALAACTNVDLVEGVLAEGHAAGAPYDLIVIDGAVGHVPDAIVAQLRVGGRLVTGLSDRGITRLATGYKSDGGFGLTEFADVDCVLLPGFARPKIFTF